MNFRILGPLEVDREGRELPLRARQQRALLALLLLHANEVVPVDEIIDELWPEAPPASAARSVHALVSRLRRLLEGGQATPNGDEDEHGILLTRAHGYVLRVAPDELDLHRFEALLSEGRSALAEGRPDAAARTLREALAIWRGPPLGEFASSSLVGVAIANLNERRLSALEERIEADLASGRTSELVAELETLVASHPLRERLRGQLMVALYRAGRQAEALQVYGEARRMLVGELGIEPSHALQRLEQAILRQDESLEPPARATVARVRRRGRLLSAAAIVCATGIALALALRGHDGATVDVAPNSLVVLDASAGRLISDVPMVNQPVAVTAGEGGVWAANRERPAIAAFDQNDVPSLTTISLEVAPSSIAAGGGAVWVTTVRGQVIRIDPEFDAVAATLDPDPLPAQYGGGAVGAGGAGVWVIGPSGTVRIDPASNRITDVVGEAAGYSTRIAVGSESVWATIEAGGDDEFSHSGGGGILYKIEGRGLMATTPLADRAIGIAVGRSAVWIVTQSGELLVVAPATAAVVGTIDVGGAATGVAVAGDDVWVSSEDGTLRRVDADRHVVTKRIRLSRPAVAVAARGKRIWVAVG